MITTYASLRRVVPPIIIGLQLLCGAMVLLSGSAPVPWLAYSAVATGVLAMLMVWLSGTPKPRADGVLFLVGALAGGLTLGSWQADFPANLPAWLWCIAAVLSATVAIVLDADSKQSRSRNRF